MLAFRSIPQHAPPRYGEFTYLPKSNGNQFNKQSGTVVTEIESLTKEVDDHGKHVHCM